VLNCETDKTLMHTITLMMVLQWEKKQLFS